MALQDEFSCRAKKAGPFILIHAELVAKRILSSSRLPRSVGLFLRAGLLQKPALRVQSRQCSLSTFREAAIDTGFEILWLMLGGAALVGFVFFILARHWTKILRHQTWTLRQLSLRVHELEALADPAFRRRLEESAPVPLEQVFTLTLRFSDGFWKNTLGLRPEDERHIREFGSFVGSVKFERWRSHTVANVNEVLPASQSARWQTRTLHYFSNSSAEGDGVQLWELALGPREAALHRADFLELQIVSRHAVDCVELRSRHSRPHVAASPAQDDLLFSIPLDRAMLALHRTPEPDAVAAPDGGVRTDAECTWKGFYSFQDNARGIEWQLWMQDLTQKAEWERWKILDAARAS
jgi:hypothetical protein